MSLPSKFLNNDAHVLIAVYCTSDVIKNQPIVETYRMTCTSIIAIATAFITTGTSALKSHAQVYAKRLSIGSPATNPGYV